MRKSLLLICGLACMTAASPASAIDGRLSSLDGNGDVHVWKDAQAYGAAQNLSKIGIDNSNPELLFNLASCTVGIFTMARTDDLNSVLIDVHILEGEEEGCFGVVPRDRFKAD